MPIPRKITERDLLDFIGGNASDEVIQRIVEERKEEGSFTQRWFEALHEALENPFDVDWKNLMKEPEKP